MFNHYTVSGSAQFNQGPNSSFFRFVGEKGNNFVSGEVVENVETLKVDGIARFTYFQGEQYGFSFIHQVGEYEICCAFNLAIRRYETDLWIVKAGEPWTNKLFGDRMKVGSEVVVCRSVDETMKLYFDLRSKISQAA